MQYIESNDKSFEQIAQTSSQRPIKVLHVVGGMVRAGTETWLMHILRYVDRTQFQMDFLVYTNEPCPYDEEIRDLGSKVIPCKLNRFKPWRFSSDLKHVLLDHGPYDIIHSHVHHFSGLVLRTAQQAGIKVRISHSHNDTSPADQDASWMRRLYLALSERWIDRYSTLGLAASSDAAINLFGFTWQNDLRWKILCCGIDLSAFPASTRFNSGEIREQLGIPEDAFVIGHVGRFESQKNHHFLIEIAAEVSQREPKMILLLIGDGPLRHEIEQATALMGLNDNVVFAGLRSDVPQLMLKVMDTFIFPSLYEGLGLALVEAQAAGLPCVLSDVIPAEADIVKPLLKRISLSQPASQWAEELLDHRQASFTISQSSALTLVKESPLNIETSLKQLTGIYQAQFERKIQHEF